MPAKSQRAGVKQVLEAGELPATDASFAQGLATADLSMSMEFVPSPGAAEKSGAGAAAGGDWGESPVWKVNPKGGESPVSVPKFELPGADADASLGEDNAWEIMPPTPARGVAAIAEPAEESEPEGDDIDDNMTVLRLTVPVGKSEGDTMEVELPGGTTLELEIPDGLEAGDEFEAEVEAAMDADGDGNITQEELEEWNAKQADPAPVPAPVPSPTPAEPPRRSSSKNKSGGGGGCCAAKPKKAPPLPFRSPVPSPLPEFSEDGDDEDTRFLMLTVPEGLSEGDTMTVDLPNGSTIKHEVPDGLVPGDEIEIEVTAEMDL